MEAKFYYINEVNNNSTLEQTQGSVNFTSTFFPASILFVVVVIKKKLGNVALHNKAHSFNCPSLNNAIRMNHEASAYPV